MRPQLKALAHKPTANLKLQPEQSADYQERIFLFPPQKTKKLFKQVGHIDFFLLIQPLYLKPIHHGKKDDHQIFSGNIISNFTAQLRLPQNTNSLILHILISPPKEIMSGMLLIDTLGDQYGKKLH